MCQGFSIAMGFSGQGVKEKDDWGGKRNIEFIKSTVNPIYNISAATEAPSPFSSLLSRMAMVSLLSETTWAFRMSALIPGNLGDDISRPS